MNFKDKICIVTGAASGIGRGISEKLLELGAFVYLTDIDEKRLDLFQSEHSNLKNFKTAFLDVTEPDNYERFVSNVINKHGRIDFLFNNAGIGGSIPLIETSYEHWEKIINLNLYGVINGINIIYPIMVRQKYGNIINTSSISGLIPFPGQVLYNTTKYAISGLTLSLYKEAKANNIYAAMICPGMVHTRIFNKPIIGQETTDDMAIIPKEAIPVKKAVEDIFNGIKKKKKIIITPKYLRKYYFFYRLFGKLP